MGSRFDLVAFDADDTLWHNETHFHGTQRRFRELLADYHPPDWIDQRLYAAEKRNLAHFGYGVKGFVLSMIETAVELTEGRVSGRQIQQIVDMGREMLAAPVEVLPGVREAVAAVAAGHRVAVVTKGDLFDQETKLARSGLGDVFAAFEVVSEKDAKTYAAMMRKLGVEPGRFVMVGNSVKSDVLPVLEAGGAAVHIPYELTWAHEQVPAGAAEFTTLGSIAELPGWLEIG
jgi:putative hydrolase of the HAD superfamily